MATGLVNTNFSLQNSAKVQNIWTSDHALSDEGSFFVFTNTPGTAIATTTSVVDDAATASATHAQNVPVMTVVNNWDAGDPNRKNIYMKYLRMVISQVPTSASAWFYAWRLDPNPANITTAGTVITPQNPNSASGTTSKAAINFGAIVTSLPVVAQSRLVSAGQIAGAIPVTKDQWMFAFGNPVPVGDSIGTQTLVKNITANVAPIVVAPGWMLKLEMWAASNGAAPSWEFEGGYVERPAGQ